MKWHKYPDVKPETKERSVGFESDDYLVYDGGTMYVAHLNFYPKKGFRLNDEYSWSENQTGCGCCSQGLDPQYWTELPEEPKENENE